MRSGQRLTLSRAALMVFAISLAVRATWVAFAHVTPISDYAGYDRLAVRWLETGQFGAPGGMAYRTPGYPGFLAAVYTVFGHSPKAAGFVQAVLGACSSGLLVLLAGRFVSARAAAVAGLLHAGWPTSIIYVPVLASENLAVPVLLLTLLGVTWPTAPRQWPAQLAAILGGIGAGLLLLVRPAAVFFLPAFALVAVTHGRRWGRIVRPALMCLGAAATLAPWFVRNHMAGLGPCTLTSVGGLNLWMGNSPGQTRGGNLPENVLPTGLSEKERDDAHRQLAVAWIRENPGQYLALCGTRACRLLLTEPDTTAGRYVRPTTENDRLILMDREHRRGGSVSAESLRAAFEVRRWNNDALRWFRVATVPILLVGLALAIPQWRRYGVFTSTFLCYGAGLSVTMFASRFRELGEPLLLVPAAALLVDLVTGSRELRGRLPRWVLSLIVGIVIAATAILEYHEILPRLYHLTAPVESAQPTSWPAQREIDLWRKPGPFRFEWPGGAVVTLRAPNRTTWGTDLRSVERRARGPSPRVLIWALKDESGSVQCDVTGGAPASARANQGGVRLLVEAIEALELDLALLSPATIKSVHVEIRDARNRIVHQWLWRIDPRQLPDDQRRTYVFSPGLPVGPFTPRPGGAAAGRGAQVCVYVTRTGAEAAIFVLHRMEVTSTGASSTGRPPDAPDTAADAVDN